MKLACGVAVSLVLAAHGTARAEDRESIANDTQKVTASWSPVHLVLPVVEVEAEFSPAPHIGVGVVLGAGRVTSSVDETVKANVFEGGAQLNYYFMHGFRGLHAGAEAIYVHAGAVQDSSVTATGLSLGPYVGYKVLTEIGFTFVAQAGVAFLTMQAESSGQPQPTMPKEIYPLINLNVGWSF